MKNQLVKAADNEESRTRRIELPLARVNITESELATH